MQIYEEMSVCLCLFVFLYNLWGVSMSNSEFITVLYKYYWPCDNNCVISIQWGGEGPSSHSQLQCYWELSCACLGWNPCLNDSQRSLNILTWCVHFGLLRTDMQVWKISSLKRFNVHIHEMAGKRVLKRPGELFGVCVCDSLPVTFWIFGTKFVQNWHCWAIILLFCSGWLVFRVT